MNTNKLKLVVAIIAILPLLAWSNSVFAWEETGTLCTGICPTTFDGTVIVPPTANPVAGTYTSAQSVVLTANGSESIQYTTDGIAPTCSTGTVYSSAISVTSSQTIKAISCYQGNYYSSVSSFNYVINLFTPVSPTANPVAGTYTSTQSITLAASGALSIRYTTNGTEPTCSTPTIYSNPVSVGSSQTIKAIACYSEGSSSVASFIYTINISTGGGGGGGGGGGTTPTVPPTTPITTKTGDANNDGKVDKYDFSLMMANWGKTGTNSSDFNNDGKVDKYDFALLMSKWGT